MKRFFFAAAMCAGLSAQAQDKPAAPAPPAAGTPGTGPAAAPAAGDAATPPPTAIADPAKRRSYALGVFFANQLKRNDDGTHKTNLADVEAGLKAILTGEKSVDFAQGATMGSMLERDDVEVQTADLLEAFRTVMSGEKSKLSENEMRSEMMLVQQEASQRRQAKNKEEGAKNLKDAEDFLTKNKSAEGVKTTASGLQYQELSAGKSDKKPTAEDMVTVNYIGTTLAGREFDRSADGSPRKVPLSINKGWGEALQLMTVGSKYRFWVPPALGWGEQGRGSLVRPNALLIYEVELLETAPAPAKTAGPGAATPPIPIPGSTPPPAGRKPITATTPPVSVEIPAKGGKPEIKVVDPATLKPKAESGDNKPASTDGKKE